jgi:hypothetical protein
MHEETTDASPMLESIKYRAYMFLELECNTLSITTFLGNAVYYERNAHIFDGRVGCTQKCTTCITYIQDTYTNACALPFNNERYIHVFYGSAGVY